MRRFWVSLVGCVVYLPGWAQTSSLSDCLLTDRIQSATCTSQIVRFESQYSYVPQLASDAGIDPALLLAVIAVESSYAQLKLTDRGGIGPMQITPIAARELDAKTLEHARALLSHADVRTTQRVYRRKPERVKPLETEIYEGKVYL